MLLFYKVMEWYIIKLKLNYMSWRKTEWNPSLQFIVSSLESEAPIICSYFKEKEEGKEKEECRRKRVRSNSNNSGGNTILKIKIWIYFRSLKSWPCVFFHLNWIWNATPCIQTSCGASTACGVWNPAPEQLQHHVHTRQQPQLCPHLQMQFTGLLATQPSPNAKTLSTAQIRMNFMLLEVVIEDSV